MSLDGFFLQPRARPVNAALRPTALATLALTMMLAMPAAQAAAVELPEELRQSEALIEALAQRGLLQRDRATAMVREGRVLAGLEAPLPAVAPAGRAGTRGESALREQVRRELREEVRAEVRDEVLSQARSLMARVKPVTPGAGAGGRAGAAPAVAVASAPPAAAEPVPDRTAGAAPVPAPVGGRSAAAAPMPSAADAAAMRAASVAPAEVPAGTVRVPYIPKPVRDAIRNEVREEVLAQVRTEQWGAPRAAAEAKPSWTDRIRIDGDLRVRAQRDSFGKDNPTPEEFVLASLAGTTRAADLAAANAAGLPLANTDEDRSRLRLRARLGVTANLGDTVTAGLRLATGSASDRVSTNQTLGQNANRYQFLLDRAHLQWSPLSWLSLSAGRMANPWFATDLQFSENLSFEGVATTLRWPSGGRSGFEPFLTMGWFPIREDAPPRRERSMAGAQVGFQWDLSRTRLRVGLARYDYRGLEGRVDPDYDAVLGAGRSYGQYEYEAGLRQRGNTLFLTNNPLEVAAGLTPDRFRWGLAARMQPMALTVAAELSHFSPVLVMLSGELVKNRAFDRAEIARRTGLALTDGSDQGVALKLTLGAAEVRQRGQWQASFGWRRLGSDAVLDAFADSDLLLGGTNIAGYSLGYVHGLDRNFTVGVRWLSGKAIDSMLVQPASRTRFGVDALQVDLNARF